ncbi:MAG: ATP-binding protein [Actinomycetota bacterium]
MRNSFAIRFAATLAGVGIAAAALTALLVNVAFGKRFDGYIDAQRQLRQDQLVIGLADSFRRYGGWNLEDLERVSPVLLADGGTLRLEASDGTVIWQAEDSPLGESMTRVHREMMGTGPLGIEKELLIVGPDGAVVGRAITRLPEAGLLPQDVAFRSAVNRLLFAGGVAAALAALALGAFLSSRATAPARALTRAARALAAGDRSVRIGLESRDEFGQMARAFDMMADTIEEEDQLRRGFAADIAHEVRTPIAILRSQVEALQDGVLESTPEALESLHEEILRLSRLIADLETVASARGAWFSLERTDLELRSALEEAVREFAGPYDAAGVVLTADLEDVEVWADPTRLHQIAANLLSNALKFTPADGMVRLTCGAEGPWAVIRVSDTGQGIPADELPRIFDRFFRGRDVRAGGSGIGLSVVGDLVRAHGGHIRASSEPACGTLFSVYLPRTSSGAGEFFTESLHAGSMLPSVEVPPETPAGSPQPA